MLKTAGAGAVRRRSGLVVLVLLSLATWTACNGDPSPDQLEIIAPSGTWSWVDFPDAYCDDGSTTGLGINPGTSSNVLVFLDEGGACWNAATCLSIIPLAQHGPYGAEEFKQTSLQEGIFDRAAADNPFRDWSFVFIPYCTADVHAGNRTTTYTLGPASRTLRHVGHANVRAFLKRLEPTFPQPAKLVLSGSSAGGFGAAFNYDTFRRTWPNAAMYLVDDSGPGLRGDAISPGLRSDWYSSWNLSEVLEPLCGKACETDLSQLLTQLFARYPKDRMALLSSQRDAVISGYFSLTPAEFQAALEQLLQEVYEPNPSAKYFVTPGLGHTMLLDAESFSQGGTSLLRWLGSQVGDDPGWKSEKP